MRFFLNKQRWVALVILAMLIFTISTPRIARASLKDEILKMLFDDRIKTAPVGGIITKIMPCTCGYTAWMGAEYLIIPKGMPVPGTYTYSATLTLKYPNYVPKPKSNMKGVFLPGVPACWMQAGTACALYPTLGLITMFGNTKL